jgi:hypothetical protein
MLQALLVWALATGVDAGVAGATPKPLGLIATDPGVIEKWVATKPDQRATVKGLVDKMKINERVAFAIVLEGYELPKSRKVDLTADLLIVDSTGRTVVDKVSVATAKTWDPATQFAVLLKPMTGMYFGTTDPEGVYSLKVTIWDQVRGSHVESTQQFTVTR